MSAIIFSRKGEGNEKAQVKNILLAVRMSTALIALFILRRRASFKQNCVEQFLYLTNEYHSFCPAFLT